MGIGQRKEIKHYFLLTGEYNVSDGRERKKINVLLVSVLPVCANLLTGHASYAERHHPILISNG
jgi:hypothetical protein